MKLKLKFRFGAKCRQILRICCAVIGLLIVLLGEAKSLENYCSVAEPTRYRKCVSILKSNANISLPINQNSTISSDIKDIWHVPSERAICIELKTNASCPHPAFLGRLAGQSLAMLDWKRQNDERFGPSMRCGSYQDRWLSAGTYFLEIIVQFCEDFGVNSLKRTQNESEWLSYDFKPKCMEDPLRNRVTEDANIVIGENIDSGLTPKGRWVPETQPEAIPKPLFHRYQPSGCLRNPDQEMCEKPTNGTQLWSYSFEWGEDKFGKQWREHFNAPSGMTKFPKVCFFGFSHSRELTTGFQSVGLGAKAVHIQAKYPEDVTAERMNRSYSENGCRALVIAVAQWPGSRFQGFPYLFDRYYAGVKAIVETAADLFADRADHVRVYMRSIHEIPICDRTASCPMADWRSPVVIHGYNHLVEKAVREIRQQNEVANKIIHFLDTSFIISPMWDSAPDWGHFPPHVTEEEAIYMASVISSDNN